MRPNLFKFIKISLSNFLEAAINIFIFLPYFFSVTTLVKTLFLPWKNLQAKKTVVGFSFNEWLNRFVFNTISCGIGFLMRLSLLSFYILVQIIFIIIVPVLGLIYLLFLPIFYIETLFQTPEDEKKQKIKSWFLASHLLEEGNRSMVEKWFEQYYAWAHLKTSWWKLSNLLTLPPLARDWAVGYTPTLDSYCEELTSPSYQKKAKNIVDREKEISQIERVLTKSEEANIIAVGEEGIGKHTIIDALSKKIYEGQTNSLLAYKRVLKINLEKILREEFLEELFTEAAEAKNIIIFIDNFEKYQEFFSTIEKFAKTPAVQFIGVTSPFFYQQIIFPHEKLVRLFTKIDVYEVTKEEAQNILLNLALSFERRYQVIIPYETIKTLIEKSDYYITYIPFPEKAIELLDEACAISHTSHISLIAPNLIDKILTEKTHIPTSLTSQMKEKLLQLETLLKSQIIQQDEAIDKLSSALRRSFLLIGKRKKPLASFLFLGPTGVGKTETAKAIAEVFFSSSVIANEVKQSPDMLLRFDMSFYQNKQDIPKLIGDIQSGNPGLLTAAIRQHPYGVLLLDELEKADHNLLNIFLSVLDEGYFTDGLGKKVDCKNLVIIATSNAPNLNVFSPEFLNRFDGVITYQPLGTQAVVLIAKKMVEKIAQDIYQLHKVTLRVSETYLTTIAQKGYHPQFGARDMERLIRQEIEDKVAKMILEGKVKEGDIINLQ